MDYKDDHRQSEVVEAMRPLLIVLVLFIHTLPEIRIPVEIQFSSMGLYRILSEMISHNLGGIAVPCFFLISGFFFFYKYEKKWNFKFYLIQLKKRSRTLLIPYLIWNLLFILAIVMKNYVFRFFALENDDFLLTVQTHSWFELLWSIPINFPLWYLRDLICMVVLSPLFFFFFRYTKISGLLLLMGAYLFGWRINMPGFSTTAFFFFGSGAFLALNKKNILFVCARFRYPIALAALFFLCCATYYNGTAYHGYILRVFVPFGVITAVNMTNRIVCYEKWRKILHSLSVTVFFIYAIHIIYIMNWLKGGFYKTVLVHDGWGMILGYLLIPCICLGVCISLYFILSKVCPRLLAVLTGNRISYYNNK